MALKRMFSREITDSDAFLDLSLPAQCLYFHLNLSCDDDGFSAAGKRIARAIGATEKELAELVENGFLISFPESGVYVVVHFMAHNVLKSDRYHPTVYQAEKKLLELTENKTYKLRNQTGTIPEPDRNQIGAETIVGKPIVAEPIVSQESGNEISKDNSTSEEERSEGGNQQFEKRLLLVMGQQAGIGAEVERGMLEHGFAAAYAAFTAWKKDGAVIGKYNDFLKGEN